MERVIVTVRRVNETRARDIELAAGLPMGELAEALAHALGWDVDVVGHPITYDVKIDPPGRLLRRALKSRGGSGC